MEPSKNLAKELTNIFNKPTNLLSIETLPSFERDLKHIKKKQADKNKLLKVIDDLACCSRKEMINQNLGKKHKKIESSLKFFRIYFFFSKHSTNFSVYYFKN